jgi:DNA-directed RNA polymerase specialized sigma24 family protein
MDDRDRLARRFEAHRLLVVLDTLTPAERLAFVLHDLFAVPFEEVAAILGRSGAARKLASRARRRVRQAAPVPDADRARQRGMVDACLADPERLRRLDLAAPRG